MYDDDDKDSDGDDEDSDRDNDDDDDGDDEDGSLGRTGILTVHSSATGSHSTTLGLDLLDIFSYIFNIFVYIIIHFSIFPYILIYPTIISFGYV